VSFGSINGYWLDYIQSNRQQERCQKAGGKKAFEINTFSTILSWQYPYCEAERQARPIFPTNYPGRHAHQTKETQHGSEERKP
jgi:hypothetical protein